MAGSADTVNIMFEKEQIKILDTIEHYDWIYKDLNEDPMDKGKERKKWKDKYPELSHYGDQIRYLVYSEFGDVRSYDYEYREKSYNSMKRRR